MLSQLLTWSFCASLSLLVLSLAGSLRLLPRLFPWLRLLIRGLLVLSFRLYYLILSWLDGAAFQHLGIDLMTGLPRVVACMVLSVLIGVLSMAIFELTDNGVWIIGIALIHGLLVSLAWNELLMPGGIQVGPRIE